MATVPGLNLCGFLTPPMVLFEALVFLEICFLGLLIPMFLFLAVVLVLAILSNMNYNLNVYELKYENI